GRGCGRSGAAGGGPRRGGDGRARPLTRRTLPRGTAPAAAVEGGARSAGWRAGRAPSRLGYYRTRARTGDPAGSGARAGPGRRARATANGRVLPGLRGPGPPLRALPVRHVALPLRTGRGDGLVLERLPRHGPASLVLKAMSEALEGVGAGAGGPATSPAPRTPTCSSNGSWPTSTTTRPRS